MTKPKDLLGPMRVPFLMLPPVCVVLGITAATWTHGHVDPLHGVLAFVGAFAAHISVNALNEYSDFRSGLDFRTKRTPFSGGSGTLPAEPGMERPALFIGLVSAAVAALIGLYFQALWGFAIVLLGALGLIVIITYTNWLTRSALLCLIAPGLGFGTFMVMGTDFVLTGSYSWTAFFASLVPFFLVSNLLLLNQFPDVEADQTIGRRHFPILIGRRQSSLIYGGFLLAAYISIVIGVILAYLPPASLLGLLSLAIAIPTLRGVIQNAENVEQLIPQMGMNVLITVATPVLVAIGLCVAP